MPDAAAISIVLPVRDAASTLGECLESIARQTFTDWELIAINDGSQDETPAVLNTFAATHGNVRVLQPGRVGLVAALNLGIDQSTAPLIARMDADDRMNPDRLAVQSEFMRDNPDIDLVATQVEVISNDPITDGLLEYIHWQNACITPEQISANIYVESPFAHPSVMFRGTIIENVGGYRDGPFPEDYELWLRMHETGCRMAKIPRVLLEWRDAPTRFSRTDPRYARNMFDRLRAEYLARDARLHSSRPIVIWGAGRKTRLRAKRLIDRGIDPIAWIDIDPRKIGRSVWDRPVHSPEWLAGLQSHMRPFILVYVTNHGARQLISAHLEEMGYRIAEDYLAVG